MTFVGVVGGGGYPKVYKAKSNHLERKEEW